MAKDKANVANGFKEIVQNMSRVPQVRHYGGCHCGAVQFEVVAPVELQVLKCNCSICVMKQNHHFIVPASKFKLTQGHHHLSTYTFNTHQAKHNFCKVCGVQSFYIPRSNPDGIGVVVHCLKEGTVQKVIYENFDGKKWEEAIAKKPDIKKRSRDRSPYPIM